MTTPIQTWSINKTTSVPCLTNKTRCNKIAKTRTTTNLAKERKGSKLVIWSRQTRNLSNMWSLSFQRWTRKILMHSLARKLKFSQCGPKTKKGKFWWLKRAILSNVWRKLRKMMGKMNLHCPKNSSHSSNRSSIWIRGTIRFIRPKLSVSWFTRQQRDANCRKRELKCKPRPMAQK